MLEKTQKAKPDVKQWFAFFENQLVQLHFMRAHKHHVPLGMLQDNGERVRFPNHGGFSCNSKDSAVPLVKFYPLRQTPSCARRKPGRNIA